MSKLICCLALLAMCTACHGAPQTAGANAGSNVSPVVLWGPPSAFGSSGDGGGGGGGM